MPQLSLKLAPDSPKHKQILAVLQERFNYAERRASNQHDKWRKAEDAHIAFMPESDIDAARRLERDQAGKPQYTTIKLPYSYSLLMASHTYWTTVFASRAPVLQFDGRHGETAQAVQAVEAIIAYQVAQAQMLVPWYIWLMDVGKYGVGIIGNFWDEEHHYIGRIEEVPARSFGGIQLAPPRKVRLTERVKGYEGNKIYNVRPYEFYPDPRVAWKDFQNGEFCFVRVQPSWASILQRKAAGYYINVDVLRKRGFSGDNRPQGSSQIDIPDTMRLGEVEPNSGEKSTAPRGLFECYINLIPSEWDLGASNFPEKWVFTVTTDFGLIVGAQPQGTYHDKYPFHIIELEPEGYAIHSRNISEIVGPIQNTIDWLINSHFYNVRKSLNNQVVVDPSRIVMRDVENPAPGGIWRLRPRAYGTDAKDAIFQVPVIDITRSHLEDMKLMFDFGNRATGVNDAIQGLQPQTGRRVTAQEFRGSTTFGINRLKTQSEYMSHMGWQPMSEMFVQNTQQFYTTEQKFKLVGDLSLTSGSRFLNVKPEDIAGFFDFVPVDGTLPLDRFAQSNLWREIFKMFAGIPELMVQYDVGKMFAWVAQLAGLKNINQFKIDIVPDEVLIQQAAAGNVVPLGGQGGAGIPGDSARATDTLGRVSESGQISGLGTSG